ncbi:HNH endonuclease [Mycobacterium phage Soul22]|uniref:HNH endonuclease n=1 Tax=Mycobacterium phage Soul22 TaxID=2743996 RepID=A0A7D5KTQ4_9CAUD|nr:HNH endonuclease [Mycobacterium phage Soul22]ARM70701.1 HNH endonuclease [Mycobacterium phage Kingsley]QGJ88275.1 HNH endonuclease [Mycobacterium phage StAnnes]QLF84320.1 HNH endonuclease [Mycobacterium phage Soul22]
MTGPGARQRIPAPNPITELSREGLAVDATQEQWRPVVGYEGMYEVSDLGRVRSVDRCVVTKSGPRTYRGRLLHQHPDGRGYLRASLSRVGDKPRMFKVHRLVLEAFVGPRPGNLSGCHNNGINTDNRLENLRWDSHTENMLDVVRHGRHHYAKRDRCPKGHVFNEPNTLISPRGARVCRTCQKQYNDRYYQTACDEKRARGWIPKRERTKCPLGHEYDYFYVNKRNGKVTRHCKTCRAQNHRNFKKRRAGASCV